MERRLSAVLVTDMVGYSRMMEADEVGTIRRQKAYRIELIDPNIAKFSGQIVKTTGDGLLAEFSSIVDAVQCAVVIQRAMVERQGDVPEDQRIRYRVGINLGDIIEDDGDIFGDGVNIASRLEQLAEPGGIRISGTAYDHLKSNVEVGYEDLGEVQVKNIQLPVRVYRVLTDPDQVGSTVVAKTRKGPRAFVMAAVIALAALIGGGVWWWTQPNVTPADPEKYAHALPDKPSVAVLPFGNLSSDGEVRFLADGFVDSLITELSSLHDIFVTARSSSFSFRGKNFEIREIAETLGVRYVVEGSFQRSNSQLRINVQLIDAITGFRIWSKGYDRPETEFFGLQDELITDLVQEIGGRAGGGIFMAERRRVEKLSSVDLTAIELWEKATQAFQKFSPEDNERTRLLALELIEKAPEHPRGYDALAWHHMGKLWIGTSENPAEDLMKCVELAHKAIDLDSLDYMGHYVLARCHFTAGNSKNAASALRRAHELNPNALLIALDYANIVLTHEGKHEEAIKLLKQLLRLSPTQTKFVNGSIGQRYVSLGEYAKAVQYYENEPVKHSTYQSSLAISLYLIGQHEEAKEVVSEIMEIAPNYSVQTFLASNNGIPKAEAQKLANALIAAGVPEISASEASAEPKAE